MGGKGGRMTTDEDGDIEVCTSQLDEGVPRSVFFLLGLMVTRKKRVKAEPPIAAAKIGSIFLIGKVIDMSFYNEQSPPHRIYPIITVPTKIDIRLQKPHSRGDTGTQRDDESCLFFAKSILKAKSAEI
jgi:hypothetical protein